jgi:RNA polymerase sigma factor (sigma-70 family)
MNDDELVERSLHGDSSAFAELVRRWAARVLAICHSRVRRADIAEDLAQDAFLRAFRSLSTLSDPSKFGPWLSGIALRVCLDWLKSPKNAQVNFSTLGPEIPLSDLLATEHDSGILSGEERRLLLREIENLPESYRQIILLYYYDDLTYRQVAELLNVSVPTVNARLAKARALLRQRLQPTS